MRILVLLLIIINTNVLGQENISIEQVSRKPYFKYVAKIDANEVTYYISEFDREKELPLIVYIQGSGYQSLFYEKGGSIVPTSGHINLPYLSQGKAKVLIIEKPGVQFLDVMSPHQRNTQFDQSFSLDSWSERIKKVIEHVILTEQIDASKVMLIGHSEGGLVAARVAKLMQQKISNVCIMAGEGPSQLYSLYSFAKTGDFFSKVAKDEKSRIQYLLSTWDDIQKDPTSTDKFFWGFTYLRWYSFLKTSVIEELSGFKGKVLILQGDKDKNVNPESSNILYIGLISKGIDAELSIMENADHSFYIKNSEINGWKTALKKSLDWFLETAHK